MPKSPFTVIVGGPEGTGGTFVAQAAASMGLGVHKTHDYMNQSCPKLVSYRDPRDMICSHARRRFADMPMKHALLASFQLLYRTHRRDEDVDKYAGDRQALMIRYEDYFLGHEAQMVLDIADFLCADIAPETAAAIAEKFSMEKNRARAAKLSPEGKYTIEKDKWMIHGGHISNNGIIGGWREVFTPLLCNLVKHRLGDFLVVWKYEKDLDW